MTPEKLADLEKLEAAATPGPWIFKGSDEPADLWTSDGTAAIICVQTSHYAHRLVQSLRNNARDLFAALREAWQERDEARAEVTRQTERLMQSEELTDQLHKERDEAREASDESEGDMHSRIRAGYDKTVADSWRAYCAKIEKERDEAREDYRRQKAEALDAFTAARYAARNLNQLRESVLSIAAQIDRAADARAAAVLIGQPPSGAATVYDLRAFAGDLRRAVEAPRDGNT